MCDNNVYSEYTTDHIETAVCINFTTEIEYCYSLPKFLIVVGSCRGLGVLDMPQ